MTKHKLVGIMANDTGREHNSTCKHRWQGIFIKVIPGTEHSGEMQESGAGSILQHTKEHNNDRQWHKSIFLI